MPRNYKIKWFDELESTNNEAASGSGYDNLSVIAAVGQTRGKGQRGNTWSSEPGMNLTFSAVYRFPEGDFPAGRQFCVSEAVACGIVGYLKRSGISAMIKWPNDIYVGDRKICGVLIENRVRNGSLTCSICGIGLNVCQTAWDQSIPNPTSVSLECGCAPGDLKQQLPLLLEDIDGYMSVLPSDHKELSALYRSLLYRRDAPHAYRDCTTGETFRGIIRDVTEKGTLLVEDGEGALREYAFKEISYIL